MAKATPVGVLYTSLSYAGQTRQFGDFDKCLLSHQPLGEGLSSAYDLSASLPSYRTREILLKDPRDVDSRLFCDVFEAATKVAEYLRSKGLDDAQLIGLFSRDYADALVQSFIDWGFDHTLFQNRMRQLAHEPADVLTPRVVIMLYLSAVFFNDPLTAISHFEKQAQMHGLLDAAGNSAGQVDAPTGSTAKSAVMVLQRLMRDGTYGSAYVLSSTEETVIGRTDPACNVISDVSGNVSRNHLRVWCEDGFWFVQGMGSTNGSVVVRADGSVETIEEPRETRPRSAMPPIVEIRRGDTLRLAMDTFFVFRAATE